MPSERALDGVQNRAAGEVGVADLCMPPPWIARFRPYTRNTLRAPPDGAAPGVRLDSNEGLDPPRAIVDRLVAFLRRPGAISHYPDEDCRALRRGLSAYVDQPVEQIVPFCGADGALEAIARSFLVPGDEAVLVSPGYDQFRAFVELTGAQPRFVAPGASPLAFDGAHFLAGCRAVRSPKLIYLINPNSPGGYAIDEETIVATLTAFPDSLVVVDETYIEFAPHLVSSVPLLPHAENLIVVRSFSKAFGLAGLRLGYAVASPRIAPLLDKVRNVKAVTALAQVAGLAALENADQFRLQALRTQATRRWFVRALRAGGIACHDTHANFVLVETAAPARVSAALAQRGIRVRDLSWIGGLEAYLRVTVTTGPDMAVALRALVDAIGREAERSGPPPASEAACGATGTNGLHASVA